MAVLAVQAVVRAGIVPALAAAAAGGDSFLNGGKVFFHAKNANVGVARTVTFASQLPAGALPQGAAKTDLAVVIPASSEKLIGPFDPQGFNDANGRVVCTYSSEADLTVGAFSLL